MPPWTAKPSVSPTVRTPGALSSARIANCPDALALRRTDEKDLAAACLMDFGNSKGNQEHSGLDGLSLHRMLQRVTEGILTEDANIDGIGGASKRLCRPFDELGEVEKEGRLHLVFIEGLPLRGLDVRAAQQEGQAEPNDWFRRTQKRHVTFPNTLRVTSV